MVLYLLVLLVRFQRIGMHVEIGRKHTHTHAGTHMQTHARAYLTHTRMFRLLFRRPCSFSFPHWPVFTRQDPSHAKHSYERLPCQRYQFNALTTQVSRVTCHRVFALTVSVVVCTDVRRCCRACLRACFGIYIYLHIFFLESTGKAYGCMSSILSIVTLIGVIKCR